MENLNAASPSLAQFKAIEQKAHQLRAEAFRDVVVETIKFTKTSFRLVMAFAVRRYRNWGWIRLEATPSLNI